MNLSDIYLLLLICFRNLLLFFLLEIEAQHHFTEFYKDSFSQRGIERYFIPNNGEEFRSRIIEELLLDWKIEKVHKAPYKPQTQGQVERFNRTLKSRIRKFLGLRIDD
ncbi:Gag-Pro-Pol polyprotein, partial [Cucumispora dikerogammari]